MATRGTPHIRRFDPNEWAAYRDLRLRALADAPDAFSSTLAQEETRPDSGWIERLGAASDDRWNEPLLAEVGGEQIGLAWGRIESVRPERADLYQMWVDPSWRGLGAGRQLVDAVVVWATRVGADYLALGVTCGDTPANRLYAAVGFEPVGQPEPLRPGSEILGQEMRLALRDG